MQGLIINPIIYTTFNLFKRNPIVRVMTRISENHQPQLRLFWVHSTSSSLKYFCCPCIQQGNTYAKQMSLHHVHPNQPCVFQKFTALNQHPIFGIKPWKVDFFPLMVAKCCKQLTCVASRGNPKGSLRPIVRHTPFGFFARFKIPLTKM